MVFLKFNTIASPHSHKKVYEAAELRCMIQYSAINIYRHHKTHTVNAKILAGKNLVILSENRDTKILANLNLAVWSWPIVMTSCVTRNT